MLKKSFTHASQQFACYSITSSALASKLGEEGSIQHLVARRTAR